jgi:hypothetical protein
MSNAEIRWLLKVASTAVTLYGLIETGRRRGWL